MLFIQQVIIPQVSFFFSQTTAQILSAVSESKARKTKHMSWSLFIFHGHSTREPASSRVTYLFCGPTQEPVLATANAGKTRERFWKKAKIKWKRNTSYQITVKVYRTAHVTSHFIFEEDYETMKLTESRWHKLKVSLLVVFLSPVNHRGLHKGWA